MCSDCLLTVSHVLECPLPWVLPERTWYQRYLQTSGKNMGPKIPTPSPWQTHTCENIIFLQLRLRAVINDRQTRVKTLPSRNFIDFRVIKYFSDVSNLANICLNSSIIFYLFWSKQWKQNRQNLKGKELEDR